MKKLIEYLEILLGVVLVSASFAFFILPSHFVAGGITGLAIVLNSFFQLKLSYLILILNIILLILAYLFIGKKFVSKTIIASLLFPFWMDYLSHFHYFQDIIKEPLLAALIGGFLLGMGTGLILKGNGSAGGYDTVGVILNKYFHVKIAYVSFILDSLMILLQYQNILSTVYGILVIIICARMINYILSYGSSQSKLTIISKHHDEIAKNLLYNQDIGLTFLKATTGYKQLSTDVIIAICPYQKINSIKKAIQEIDPQSFVIIEDVHSVLGQGYSFDLRT